MRKLLQFSEDNIVKFVTFSYRIVTCFRPYYERELISVIICWLILVMFPKLKKNFLVVISCHISMVGVQDEKFRLEHKTASRRPLCKSHLAKLYRCGDKMT